MGRSISVSELNQKWEELHTLACNLTAITANDEGYTETKKVYLELAERIAVEAAKLNVEGEEVQKRLADLYWDVLAAALEKGFDANKGKLKGYVLGHKQLKAQAIREASLIQRPPSQQSKLNQLKKERNALDDQVEILRDILNQHNSVSDKNWSEEQLEVLKQRRCNITEEIGRIENKGKTSSINPFALESEDASKLAHDPSPVNTLIDNEEKSLRMEVSRKGCDVVFHILSNANYMAGFGLSLPDMDFVENAYLGQIGKEVLKNPLFIRDYLFTSPEYLTQNSVLSNINEGSNLLDIRQWAIHHSKELNLA
jgi:hypothetical protein